MLEGIIQALIQIENMTRSIFQTSFSNSPFEKVKVIFPLQYHFLLQHVHELYALAPIV